ncbi:MAG TPA: MlaD family protein [Acidobacteriaceae bacterium]|nr:MlaD family protein [Acidobacteriaceae bacterium]
MPSQKELRWSQLKVGILTLAALTTLTILIFILSGSTGGLFTRKITLIAYFQNSNGLKVGAPVTLDGVTIGNVTHLRIVPHHEPNAIEVVSKVGASFLPTLHTDSTVSIAQAGVLGDSFVEISSLHATGPEPKDFTVLTTDNRPGISDVINSSQASIDSINQLIHKVSALVDTLNNGEGTAGMFLKDPEMARKVAHTITQLDVMTTAIASGKGSVGKLITDDALYTKLNDTVAKLNDITVRLDKGEGTAGKLLRDETLYKNLNVALDNTNQLLHGINSGQGSLGKLAKDPAVANELQQTLGHLNGLLKGMREGQGTLGQIVTNRELYDNLSKTLNDTGQLVSAIRKDPKTYLTVRVKVF